MSTSPVTAKTDYPATDLAVRHDIAMAKYVNRKKDTAADQLQAAGLHNAELHKAETRTFAATAFDSGEVRDDKKHVEMLIKVRSRMVRTKKVAMDKLEHGKTLDYDVTTLELMSLATMQLMAKKYHIPLSADESPEELRTRLAGLLLRERMRSNAYKKNQSAKAGDQYKNHADKIIESYEMNVLMHAEEFSGMTGMTPEEHEAVTKMETNKQIAQVQSSALETRKALSELEAWCDFLLISTDLATD